MKQKGFDIFFIQKYESNYYLGSRSRNANNVDFCRVNSLLSTYQASLLNKKD